MDVVDFKKTYKHLYSPKPGVPEIITIPKMQFAMIDGSGDPNTSQEFQDATGALYSTVYGLKFSHKKHHKSPEFTVGALEGLWWTKAGKMFEIGQKKDWLWTLMIWLPDEITQDEFAEQIANIKAKKPNPELAKLRLESLEEGPVVQIMHVGPYADEQPNVDKMHAFAKEQGYEQCGKHHEIYLGDPRRTDPNKLRTIVRHPIQKVAG